MRVRSGENVLCRWTCASGQSRAPREQFKTRRGPEMHKEVHFMNINQRRLILLHKRHSSNKTTKTAKWKFYKSGMSLQTQIRSNQNQHTRPCRCKILYSDKYPIWQWRENITSDICARWRFTDLSSAPRCPWKIYKHRLCWYSTCSAPLRYTIQVLKVDMNISRC